MVDPISVKTGPAVARLVAVSPVNKLEAAKPVASAAPAVQTQATALTSEMAAKPPVDAERVAKIKKAIADGDFPMVPSTVADRLLALKMQWKPNDPS
jgi:negative regulator of flagellin synthesis FlgM